MIDEHAEAPPRAGAKLATIAGQVIDSLQVLHHDAHVAQVIAPDLLDQLGVVPALHVDPAGPGHPRPAARPPAGPGEASDPAPGRPGRAAAGTGLTSVTGLPSSRNPAGPQREHPLAAEPVLQRDGVLLAGHHGAAEAAAGFLDDQPAGRPTWGGSGAAAAATRLSSTLARTPHPTRAGRYRTSRTGC